MSYDREHGEDPRTSPAQIAEAFDPAYHQSRVDEVFERVGLG